jgi:prophage tail gpP-like protein
LDKAQVIVTVPVSIGELLDKISILEIKMQHITNANKRKNIECELELLTQEAVQVRIPHLEAELKKVNETLWDIEDRIREKDHQQTFDDEFIELARSVYITNDKRAEIKRQINMTSGSFLVEEKSYRQQRVMLKH